VRISFEVELMRIGDERLISLNEVPLEDGMLMCGDVPQTFAAVKIIYLLWQ
jgi:hypothetical protein